MAFPGRNIGSSPYTESLTDSGPTLENNEDQPDRNSTNNHPYAKPQYSRAASVRSINVISDEDSDEGDGKSMMDVILQRSARLNSSIDDNNQEPGMAEPVNSNIDNAKVNENFSNNPFSRNNERPQTSNANKLEVGGDITLATAIPGSSKPSTPKIIDTTQTTPTAVTARGSAGTNLSSGGASNPQFISAAMMSSEGDAPDPRAPSFRGDTSRSIRSSRSVASQTPIADRFSGPISPANNPEFGTLNGKLHNNQWKNNSNKKQKIIQTFFLL